MPLDHFSTLVVARLNQLEPGGEWVDAHWMDNVRPWVRIYKQAWTNHPLASTLRRANRNGQYPPLWFELACLKKLDNHDGRPPFDIYVPIDERGLHLGDVEYRQLLDHPGWYLPFPDLYRRLLLCLSGCYQSYVRSWCYNVSNSVNTYLGDRHFVDGHNNFALPRDNARIQLDSGVLTIHAANDDGVESCAQFIIRRAPTLDCALSA